MAENLDAIYKESLAAVETIYPIEEAGSIVNILFEDLLGISKSTRILQKNAFLTAPQNSKWREALERLKNHEPIQYILGFTYFLGRQFFVNPSTLIPRQETEELVSFIVLQNKQQKNLTVLDIGSGCGCISISLDLQLKDARVVGWEISKKAKMVAEENALKLGSKAKFEHIDVFKKEPDSVDIIVSNPPYIPHYDKKEMAQNVLNFEPDIALFVPDEDPLIFYKHIAKLAEKALNPSGKLYFEVHEHMAKEVTKLLSSLVFHEISIQKDMNGKERIVSAVKATPHDSSIT